MEALLIIFHRGVHEKYYIALNTMNNGSFASLTVEQGEKLVENIAQSEQVLDGDCLNFLFATQNKMSKNELVKN